MFLVHFIIRLIAIMNTVDYFSVFFLGLLSKRLEAFLNHSCLFQLFWSPQALFVQIFGNICLWQTSSLSRDCPSLPSQFEKNIQIWRQKKCALYWRNHCNKCWQKFQEANLQIAWRYVNITGRWVMGFFYKGVKFSFSEKATKICTICLMVMSFT